MSAPRPTLYVRRALLGVSVAVAVLGAYQIGRSFLVDGALHFGNPVDDTLDTEPTALLAPPISVHAEITRVSGASTLKPGQTCHFLVEQRQRDARSLYCNAQVTCAGTLLYGGPDRGYFPCRFYDGAERGVVGSDASTTRQDRDAAFSIDTHNGLLRVWDDASGALGAFELEAEVLSAH